MVIGKKEPVIQIKWYNVSSYWKPN
jgi:hypothetical protein